MGSPWAPLVIWGEWEHRHWGESKTSKRGQRDNQSSVGHETRFSQHIWEGAYIMIFWKSWNWPLYCRECLQYWLRWHLVIETSSSTVKRPNVSLRYYRLSMWRHVVTQHWSFSSAPTDQGNSHASGFKIQNTLITGHISQLKISGPLRSMLWKHWGHFDIGPCGCQRGIQSHFIRLSQCTTTCSITWTAWCKLWPRRWLHGWKTCSMLWNWLDRSCPNTTLEWLQRQACCSFLHIFLMLFGSCDHLESGTREWILILRKRHPILPNTKRPFWSVRRKNTVPNIDVWWSIDSKAYRTASSPPL